MPQLCDNDVNEFKLNRENFIFPFFLLLQNQDIYVCTRTFVFNRWTLPYREVSSLVRDILNISEAEFISWWVEYLSCCQDKPFTADFYVLTACSLAVMAQSSITLDYVLGYKDG